MLVGAHHLGAQHRLVKAELTVELGYRRRLRLRVEDDVDAFGMLGDLVGQPPLTPDVDLFDGSAVLADDVEERLQRRSNGAFVERGVKNDHYFVWTHGNLTTSSGLCGHGRSVAGGSPASATALGYRTLSRPEKSGQGGPITAGLAGIRWPWPRWLRRPWRAHPSRTAGGGCVWCG